ncbi:hypothetical protein EDB92DRAFT_1638817 [Lactarius akahatsu]|uniref:Uncharacterized protein n=1 Tax=Lactarius akahatsu TaxID=416441 RepID=A0AAD4LBU8_9AGAM|nr:hypothetical protein EDB92DRAFT_1638817 [Lactarius akahatsu]
MDASLKSVAFADLALFISVSVMFLILLTRSRPHTHLSPMPTPVLLLFSCIFVHYSYLRTSPLRDQKPAHTKREPLLRRLQRTTYHHDDLRQILVFATIVRTNRVQGPPKTTYTRHSFTKTPALLIRCPVAI